jgi:hypothetical protein
MCGKLKTWALPMPSRFNSETEVAWFCLLRFAGGSSYAREMSWLSQSSPTVPFA